MGVGAMGVGMGQSAFDHAAAHLRSRSAFGSKLGGFQHWQFRMAEHAIALEAARARTRRRRASPTPGDRVNRRPQWRR
jgi:alkylation response protein AidB-like acyl-CoA dehydrogenase